MSKKIHLPDAKSEIARPQKIRDINRQIVLNYIRDRAPLSRADIARQTALQRSTVSAIVDSLLNSNLVEEIGAGDSTGGRKPRLLQLRKGVPVAIGVALEPRKTLIGIADLLGAALEVVAFPTTPDLSEMTKKIVFHIKSLAEKHSARSLEIGISLPGITDSDLGIVRYVPFFGWRDWEIGAEIENQTGFRVIADNDANSLALADLWFGRERMNKVRDFVTVLVADGIGTGIIFDGQVYRGEKGAAGEFGHMIVGEHGPARCSCGSFSCWEAFASDNALKARYRASLNGSRSEKTSSTKDICDLALAGDQNAINAFKNTAKFLGIGISNLIVGFSPQAVNVCGQITKVWEIVEEDLYSAVETSIRTKLPRTTIRPSTLGAEPTFMGAISLVLARRFSAAS